jgi:hypothetical protein
MPSRSITPAIKCFSPRFPTNACGQMSLISCLLHRPAESTLGDVVTTGGTIVARSAAARQTVRAAGGPGGQGNVRQEAKSARELIEVPFRMLAPKLRWTTRSRTAFILPDI